MDISGGGFDDLDDGMSIYPESDCPCMEQSYQGNGDWAEGFAEKLQQTILEQAAMINELRAVIQECYSALNFHGESFSEIVRTALAVTLNRTNSQSLTAHDNAIRAEVAEELLNYMDREWSRTTAKVAILQARIMARKYKE